MSISLRGFLAFALLLFFRTALPATENPLAVVNAGVEQEDNGAFAPHDYEFLPGDPLYVVFEIAGFHVDRDDEKDTRTISLTWEVSLLDDAGVLLAPPQAGSIKTGISPEDKRWLPKRRAQFDLPQLMAAGTYHVHIETKDLLGNTEAAKDIPFLVGGRRIEPSRTVAVQQINFARSDSGPKLDLPAFQPGDTIFLSFDIAGFAESSSHEYRVRYRFDVIGPDGKLFVHQPDPMEIRGSSFYPAKFLPVNFSISTPSGSQHGKYTLVLNVTDLTSNQTSTAKAEFTLE